MTFRIKYAICVCVVGARRNVITDHRENMQCAGRNKTVIARCAACIGNLFCCCLSGLRVILNRGGICVPLLLTASLRCIGRFTAPLRGCAAVFVALLHSLRDCVRDLCVAAYRVAVFIALGGVPAAGLCAAGIPVGFIASGYLRSHRGIAGRSDRHRI